MNFLCKQVLAELWLPSFGIPNLKYFEKSKGTQKEEKTNTTP